jgi:hypothetical protein
MAPDLWFEPGFGLLLSWSRLALLAVAFKIDRLRFSSASEISIRGARRIERRKSDRYCIIPAFWLRYRLNSKVLMLDCRLLCLNCHTATLVAVVLMQIIIRLNTMVAIPKAAKHERYKNFWLEF